MKDVRVKEREVEGCRSRERMWACMCMRERERERDREEKEGESICCQILYVIERLSENVRERECVRESKCE